MTTPTTTSALKAARRFGLSRSDLSYKLTKQRLMMGFLGPPGHFAIDLRRG